MKYLFVRIHLNKKHNFSVRSQSSQNFLNVQITEEITGFLKCTCRKTEFRTLPFGFFKQISTFIVSIISIN